MAEFFAYKPFNYTTESYPILAFKGAVTQIYDVSYEFSGITYDKSLVFDYANDSGNKSILIGGTDLVTPPSGLSQIRVSGTGVKLLVGFTNFWAASPVADYALVGNFSVAMWNELLHGLTEDNPAAIFAEALKGADQIKLSAGNDWMSGFAGDDVIYGNGGHDVLEGDSGNDRISGGNGHDTLSGGAGNDALSGGAGDDNLLGDSGNDVLNGGTGIDTVHYELLTAGVTVDLGVTTAQVTGGGGKDRLFDIENIVGTGLADQLTGNSGANALTGLGGNDVLRGSFGNDVLEGGIGVNTLDGGGGSDTADYWASISGITLWLGLKGAQAVAKNTTDTLIGIENVSGSRFPDTIRGDASGNVISGGAMADKLYGGDGNDKLYGNAESGMWVDGNNKLYGQGGNDTLIGAGGMDYIAGGIGADILDGKGNSDVLIGGTGADRFVMALEYLPDQITDFSSADGDKVQLSLSAGSDGLKFVFGAGAGGTLSEDEFYAAPGANVAHDASDRIIFDSTSGSLFYDADGTGTDSAAQLIASFTPIYIFDPLPVLTASDFQIVA